MTKNISIYLRVSKEKQTTENQLRTLKSIIEQRGWTLTKIYKDHGISGMKGREKRSGLNDLLNDLHSPEWDLLMIWDLSRLSRSLIDLMTIIKDINSSHKEIYIHQSQIDTSTPSGKMMISMIGIFSEYERDMISERIKSGLERTRSEGKTLGRPKKYKDEDLTQIKQLMDNGHNISQISRKLNMSRTTIYSMIN